MSEMSQAQTPEVGTSGPDPLADQGSEVAEDLGRSDRTEQDTETSGSVQPQNPEDDGLLTADVGPDHNAPSAGDLREPGDPDSASDPMPDIAGTGS